MPASAENRLKSSALRVRTKGGREPSVLVMPQTCNAQQAECAYAHGVSRHAVESLQATPCAQHTMPADAGTQKISLHGMAITSCVTQCSAGKLCLTSTYQLLLELSQALIGEPLTL